MKDEELTARIRELEGNPSLEPLTNWSDLGPLIEKYGIYLDPWFRKDHWHAGIVEWEDDDGIEVFVLDKDPKMAACLAIIEAKGGMGDE